MFSSRPSDPPGRSSAATTAATAAAAAAATAGEKAAEGAATPSAPARGAASTAAADPAATELERARLIAELDQDRLWLLRQIDAGRWAEWRLDLAALERELGQLLDQLREHPSP